MSPSRLERFRLFFLAAFLPLSVGWSFLTRLRLRWVGRPFRSRIPVVSVGNIHSGGTGKTPLVMALAEALKDRFPTIVSRGYGGSAENGAWVDLASAEGPARFGDEPWMMATQGPTPVYVDRDRCRAVRAVETRSSGLVLLDDGFQHVRLDRKVDLVVLPGRLGPERAYCHPYGDLREPLTALARASAFLLTGDHEVWDGWLQQRFPAIPRFFCGQKVVGAFKAGAPGALAGVEFGAFCGLGDPESFRRSLTSFGSPVFFEAFADHHVYSESELARLAAKLPPAATLVTTEKDWVKLSPTWQGRVATLRIRAVLPEDCIRYIETQLEAG